MDDKLFKRTLIIQDPVNQAQDHQSCHKASVCNIMDVVTSHVIKGLVSDFL